MVRKILLAGGFVLLSVSPSLAISEVVVPPSPYVESAKTNSWSGEFSSSKEDKGFFERGSFYFSVDRGRDRNGGIVHPYGPNEGPPPANYGPPASSRGYYPF